MASCYPGWWASSSGAGATTHPKPHHADMHSRARAHSSCSNPARRVASLPPKRSKIDGKELIKLSCQGAGENATAKRADPSAQRTRGGRARERCKENKRLLTNINISLKCFTAHSYMDSTAHTRALSRSFAPLPSRLPVPKVGRSGRDAFHPACGTVCAMFFDAALSTVENGFSLACVRCMCACVCAVFESAVSPTPSIHRLLNQKTTMMRMMMMISLGRAFAEP